MWGFTSELSEIKRIHTRLRKVELAIFQDSIANGLVVSSNPCPASRNAADIQK
jgi:hypothetical protein